jgi:DNA primase small subunit
LLDELEKMENKEAIKFLISVEGIGKKGAENLLDGLFEGGEWQRKVDTIRKDHNLNILNDKEIKIFMGLVMDRVTIDIAGETDEPVTSDVKRLIRLPTSIHGKSSLRVVPMAISDIKDFEPLTDAVAFSDDPVNITALKDADIEMKGEKVKLQKGCEYELPCYMAMFAFCRRLASAL